MRAARIHPPYERACGQPVSALDGNHLPRSRNTKPHAIRARKKQRDAPGKDGPIQAHRFAASGLQ